MSAGTFAIPSPFEWDESFDVKVGSINEQHKRLFTLINELDADRTSADKLKALLDYVVLHFKTEEDLFEAHSWEGGVGHKATHDKFVEDASKVTEVTDGVMDFIKNWLVNHIKGSDMRYADFLSGAGAA